MEKYRIEEARKEIERKDEEREEKQYQEELEESKERAERRMEEKQAIHINLISSTEMKAHTKVMRDEMDRKFTRCLMVTGLDTREAIRRVKVWNNEWDSEKHGS